MTTTPVVAEAEETPSVAPRAARPPRSIPGFAPSLAITGTVLVVLVLVPLGALVLAVARAPWDAIVRALTDARTLAAVGLSVGASGVAALVSAPLGVAIAWTLARYELPGRRLLDAIVDVPFALPTAVSGIALTALCAPSGWVGALFAPLGIELAFNRVGIAIALLFTGLPFVVRTVQPVIEDLPAEIEEAASSLGASRAQTFLRVILPSLMPSIVAGTTLAFARALGEYGSVVFIAGNMPMRTEIAPLRILSHLEGYDYASAAVVALAMLVASAGLLFAVNAAQRRLVDRGAKGA
ncbi:sulfate ABC transporter permease subunit CysT [Sandaracinus amylolyticus]|uniref:sulfate ABC transporter permease subunit CysT n=1 Tax=Sandaracinus amylolyticus TaxID=927083 RepID=UPI001F01FE49|nr:sulfate ABC transporter permease subunit CysT [Sandaracinus amylolyticus]UJR81743.1 Sulfate transport system permease protein CysT [Sandaracinus amylolyticus]